MHTVKKKKIERCLIQLNAATSAPLDMVLAITSLALLRMSDYRIFFLRIMYEKCTVCAYDA